MPGSSVPGAAAEPAFDLVEVRAQFPILDRELDGRPLVYLDSAATSQRPRAVLDAERAYLETENSAVHRGAHSLAGEATDRFEAARERVARFVGAPAHELVWTANATSAINLVAYALGNASLGRGGATAERFRIRPGDELVVTELEHHANLLPWQELAARTGARIRAIGVDDAGRLRLDHAAEVIGPRTRVVAVSHVSNVLGIVNPVAELADRAREVGALVVLDACQSAPHLPLDLPALGVDLAAFSAHKMLGPTGIGALWGRSEVLDALPPVTTGGSTITRVTLEEAEFLPPPHRFEAGTQAVSQAVAWAAACDWIETTGRSAIAEWEAALGDRMRRGLAGIRGVRVLGVGRDGDAGDGAARIGLASFEVDGVHAHDAGQFLDDRGIAVRVGHHCAQPLHRRLGLAASTRASVAPFSSAADVDAFLDAVAGIRSFFHVDGRGAEVLA